MTRTSLWKSPGFWAACLLVLVGLMVTGTVSNAAPPPSVAVVVDAGISTGADGPVTPTHPGGSDQWVYDYTINAGQSVTDTLPLEICVTTQNAGWTLLTLQIGAYAPAGNLPGV